MATLYDLTGEMLLLYQMMEDPDADDDAILDTMESVNYEIEDKADGYAKIIKMLNAEAEAIKKEEKRLEARRKSLENRSDKLKKALEESMIVLKMPKIKTLLFSFSIQKNPPSVNIIGKIPERFLIPQEPKVDTRGIIDYCKEHGNTEYAELTQSESLRIR